MARLTQEEIAEIDKRTTDIGLFNFAESYLLCGKTLTGQKIDGLRFADPIEYQFYHAIELFLKSYLRNKGMGAYELATSYSHNLIRLKDRAASFGLILNNAETNQLKYLQGEGLVIEARYIKTGHKRPLDLETLLGLAERIRDKVQSELMHAGVALRPGPFYPGIAFDSSYRTIAEASEDK